MVFNFIIIYLLFIKTNAKPCFNEETMQQSTSQPSTSVSDLTEVLEQPCKTVEELEELCDKLKDAEFRKKMVCAITQATLLVIFNL